MQIPRQAGGPCSVVHGLETCRMAAQSLLVRHGYPFVTVGVIAHAVCRNAW